MFHSWAGIVAVCPFRASVETRGPLEKMSMSSSYCLLSANKKTTVTTRRWLYTIISMATCIIFHFSQYVIINLTGWTVKAEKGRKIKTSIIAAKLVAVAHFRWRVWACNLVSKLPPRPTLLWDFAATQGKSFKLFISLRKDWLFKMTANFLS